ncbi:MAG: hypothetical protein AAFY56_01170 [Pseudomonadota bacterium]
MRVLLIEDNAVDALAIQCEIGAAHDVRAVGSLDEALHYLSDPKWFPELIVVDTAFSISVGAAAIDQIQSCAPGVPLVLGTETAPALLRAGGRALNNLSSNDDADGLAYFRMLSAQQQAMQLSILPSRSELAADIEKITCEAVHKAVDRSVKDLIVRLGLDDEEGMRVAVRLARGWEAAKSKFIAALMTGIAGALLMALAAGIVAMMKVDSRK